ncbi:MAG TPA: hypothetical protein VJ723_01060 [Candidatus Angelobacter sp.]|nr:hypothetical protein [Candidatus Angelobacter sp.]
MPDAPITLRTLFEPDDNFYNQLMTAGEQELGESKDRATRLVHSLRWQAIAGELRARAPEMLNVDVMDLLTGAWEKYRVLSDLAEESRLAKEPEFFPLGDHTIHVEVHPYLEVRIGSFSSTITLDVTADLELKMLTLKIENGRITAIQSGSCEGCGEIKYKQLCLLNPTFKSVQLPGQIKLGAGIPLRREPAAQE